MQRREQIRRNPTAAYVATGLAVIGFGLILIAWNGAAEVSIADAQFPFFMAGGVIGLGLILVGAALMVIETMRRDADLRSIELGRLAASLRVLHGELGSAAAAPPERGGSFQPQPRSGGGAADETVELGQLRDAAGQQHREG